MCIRDRFRDYCDGLRRSQDEIMPVHIASDVPELLRERNAREHREAMIQLTGGKDPDLVETLLMGGVQAVDLLRDICGEPDKVDYCDISVSYTHLDVYKRKLLV